MAIKLRKVEKEDWDLFLKWWNDDKLIQLTSGINKTTDNVLFGYFQKMISSKKNYNFIILLDNEPIGHIALSHKNKDTSEINIIIGDAKYRGLGFGTEAIKKVVKFAFDKLKYDNIVLEVRPDNEYAIRSYEKSGFIRGGLKKYPGTTQPVTLLMSLNKPI